MGLDAIFKYSNPLKLDVELYDKNEVRNHEFDFKQIESILEDLNEIGPNLGFKKRKFTNYDLQYVNSVSSCIFNYFRINGNYAWIDNEYFTGNYVYVFQSQFAPILRKFGIKNIELSQFVESLPNETKYKLFIKGNNQTYLHQYIASNNSWFEPTRLTKLINLVLKSEGKEIRFIQVFTGDQTSVFILGIPNQIKSILEKYTIQCWATKEGDF